MRFTLYVHAWQTCSINDLSTALGSIQPHIKYILYVIYIPSFANILPVEMCIWTSQSDSSQGILIHSLYSQHHEVRDQVDWNTIVRGRVSKFNSQCFHQNSVSQSRFEAEEPSPHIRPAVDIRVFWRSPRTGTKCITSSALSPSCIPIFKSNEREIVNVPAKNVNTSQSDR